MVFRCTNRTLIHDFYCELIAFESVTNSCSFRAHRLMDQLVSWTSSWVYYNPQ